MLPPAPIELNAGKRCEVAELCFDKIPIVTGQLATSYGPRQLSLSQLQSFASANDLIVMDTPGRSNLPFGLVNDHAYMFEGIVNQGGSAMIKLGNPWGTDQPQLIPFASLSKGINEIDVCPV